MANFKCLKIEKGCIHPTHPLTLTAYPIPGKVVPQFFFFHENDRKGCKGDTYMPLVTFFSVLERPGKSRKGGCNNPLGKTRVKQDFFGEHVLWNRPRGN